MKRFNTILVVLDPDKDQQLARAADLAKLNQAKLRVLAVFEDPPIELGGVIGAARQGNLRQRIERLQRERIEKLFAPLRRQGIDLSLSIDWYQTPFVPIVRAVVRDGHDLLI